MKGLSTFKFLRGIIKEQPDPDPAPYLRQFQPISPVMTNRYLVEFMDYPQIPPTLCILMTPINVHFDNHLRSYDNITFSLMDTEETPIMSILMEGLNGDTRDRMTINVKVLDATGVEIETIQIIGHIVGLESVERGYNIDDPIIYKIEVMVDFITHTMGLF